MTTAEAAVLPETEHAEQKEQKKGVPRGTPFV